MKIIDLQNPKRVERPPNQTITLFDSGSFTEQGFQIKAVELRLYIEKSDEKLGPYSLITSFVETDKGSIEMLYDEGFRGKNSLQKSAKFLQSNLGLSGLVLRSIIGLKSSTT